METLLSIRSQLEILLRNDTELQRRFNSLLSRRFKPLLRLSQFAFTFCISIPLSKSMDEALANLNDKSLKENVMAALVSIENLFAQEILVEIVRERDFDICVPAAGSKEKFEENLITEFRLLCKNIKILDIQRGSTKTLLLSEFGDFLACSDLFPKRFHDVKTIKLQYPQELIEIPTVPTILDSDSQNLTKIMKLQHKNEEIKELLMKSYNKIKFTNSPLAPLGLKKDTKVIFAAPDNEGSLRVTSICTMKKLAEYIYTLSIAIDGNAKGIVKIKYEPTFLVLPPDYYQPHQNESNRWAPVLESGKTFMKPNNEVTIAECKGFCAPDLWLFLKFNS